MKYIKLFDSLSALNIFKQTDDFIAPNVSLVENEDEVYYNPLIMINPSVSMNGWTYGETASNPVISGNTGNGIVTYMYKVSTADDSTYTAIKPSETGTYIVKATIMAKGQYSAGLCTTTFTISKASINPSVSMGNWTYGGTASNPVVTGNTGNASVTYMYKVSTADDNTYTSTKPSDAGTYIVQANIEASEQYSGGSCTTTFTINKASINPSVSISDWAYGDNASIPSVTGNTDNGSVTYTYSSDNSTWSSTQPTDAGSYYIKATIDATSNYNGASCTNTFTISKVTPTIVSPVPNVLTFNKSAQELATIGSTDFGTLKYSLDNSSWSTSMPTGTNGGTYTLYYKVDGDGNINNVAANSITCSIAEKRVSSPTIILSQELYTYNGSACTPTPTVKDGNDVIDPIEYNVSYLNNTNAGTASIVISDIVDGNYYIEGVQTFTIDKANINPSVTIEDWDEGNTASTPIVSGNSGNGNVTYMYKVNTADDSTYTPTIPSTEGIYTIKATIDATSNYNGASCISTFEIIRSSTNNIITYSAPSKLSETTDTYSGGLHTNAFNTSIKSHTFKYGAGTIEFNDDVTYIGQYAFYKCFGLTNITIPDSVTSIGDHAFYNCSGLTNITIPDSVTSIGDHAFYNCPELTNITIPDSVTSIGNEAFNGCYGLTSVTIPNLVTEIGQSTFQGCSGLTSVTIGNGVTSIGNYAFNGCSGLTSVTIGNGVTSIGNYAFKDCTRITNITIPDSVTSIGGSAFAYCTGITSVTIGNGVTSIGDSAFYDCSSLTSVTLNNSIVSKTYASSSNIKNIFGAQVTEYTIGNNVTSIGDFAFYNCSNLTSIIIGNGLASIGKAAFQSCSKLEYINISRSSAPTIYSNTFKYVKSSGILVVPSSNSGYDTWMNSSSDYLGYYRWEKFINNGNIGNQELTGLYWSKSSLSVTSSYYTLPTLTKPSGITVTYSSSNTEVATVNSSTGTVTIRSTSSSDHDGTTYISALFSGNSTYRPKKVEYELNVDLYTPPTSGGGSYGGGE